MKGQELRKKFLEYFQSQEHAVIESSSLIPDNDPSVLLTTAGMQQFKPYFIGEKNPDEIFHARRLTSSQRCFRTSDIDNVGDASHLTFFEMLGNFSIGDYSKAGAIRMAWECLTQVLKLNKKSIWVTIFAGDDLAIKDFEAQKLWTEYVDADRIVEFGRSDNWWGPPGTSGPCGPCSELHIDLTGQACDRGSACRPNCACGRFLEVWNLVFMEYFQDEAGAFTSLPAKNVDTGLGLERLALISQKKSSPFETDLFTPIMDVIENVGGIGNYQTETEKIRRSRIVADHLKGATFLVADGVRFSNKEQGYILRRIFRRALDHLTYPLANYPKIVAAVLDMYREAYPYLTDLQDEIHEVMRAEATAYDDLVNQTLKKIASRIKRKSAGESLALTPAEAFEYYSTFGVSLDRLKREGYTFDIEAVEKKVAEHKQKSRAGMAGKFGGHGLGYALDTSGYTPEDVARVTRMHTATHLLHQALRTVLGQHVQQNGSDITPERLRFDFAHPEKLTPEQRAAVEELVNQQVNRHLPVTFEEIDLAKAVNEGALSFFKEKYPPKVKVYTVGGFSKEICGGPHVNNSSEVGRFRIISEKSSSAGVRRIKAVVED